MKNHIVFLLFSLLLVQSLPAQTPPQPDSVLQIGGLDRYNEFEKRVLEPAEYQVLYRYTYPVIDNGKRINQTDTMVLVIGKNHSVYYDWNRDIKYNRMFKNVFDNSQGIDGYRQTTFQDFNEIVEDEKYLSEVTLKRNNAEIVKDRQKKVITTNDLDDSDMITYNYYQLQEEIAPQAWNFIDETMEVLGYTCLKAVCTFAGRDYTAWFSPDMPIPEGPYKFYGLPGLILKLEDSANNYAFTAIGLQKLQNSVIVADENPEIIKCTPMQYKAIKKRMIETKTLFYVKKSTIYHCRKRVSVEVPPIENN